MIYYDWTYFVIVLPVFLLAMIASGNVNATYRKYAKVHSTARITGAEAAERVLRGNGVTGVRIEQISGNLTDNYDPRDNVIHLSRDVYSSTSVAAIGVAAHEAGHACQYAENYGPIKLRMAIIPMTNIGSQLSIPLIILGIVLSGVSQVFYAMAYVGLFLFALCVFFQLVTLPVEFNASRRALQAISSQGMLSDAELRGSKKVLHAAAMTYVAALAVALAQLFRFVLLVGGSRRD
ncbi:MAG: zinc metallopeptidase [Oscillospiraceae bacterium]|jgi:Zn-dependent membrane protease YugP